MITESLLKVTMRKYTTLLLLLFASLVMSITAHAKDKLTVGITLHPYYSYVKGVVGDKAEVIPLIDSGFNPHNYHLNPTDIARLRRLDALVVNGIGHDDFALEAIERIKLPQLTVINANESVALLGNTSKANSHTFVGIDTAIRQVYTIDYYINPLNSIQKTLKSSKKMQCDMQESYVKRKSLCKSNYSL